MPNVVTDMRTIENTDSEVFLRDVNVAIHDGWVIARTFSDWRWRTWRLGFGRWVLYLVAVLEKQDTVALQFNFGPVQERPLPKDEGPQE